MSITMGSLKASSLASRREFSSPVTVEDQFNIEILYNDAPVILMFKKKTGTWQYRVINNEFSKEGITNCEVKLSAILARNQRVVYRLHY